jgi:hypothetical protein
MAGSGFLRVAFMSNASGDRSKDPALERFVLDCAIFISLSNT